MKRSPFSGSAWLLLMLGMIPGGSAQAQMPPYLSFGSGNRSCAHWLLDAATERIGEDYIAGFWTGLNFGSLHNRTVGRSTDAVGKIEAVRAVCAARPDMALVDATLAAYVEMKGREAAKAE